MPPDTIPRQRSPRQLDRQPRLTLHPDRGAVVKAAAAIQGQKVIEYAETAMGNSVYSILNGRPIERDWSPSPKGKGLMAICLSPGFSHLVRQAAEIEGLTLGQMADKYLFPVALEDLRNALADL